MCGPSPCRVLRTVLRAWPPGAYRLLLPLACGMLASHNPRRFGRHSHVILGNGRMPEPHYLTRGAVHGLSETRRMDGWNPLAVGRRAILLLSLSLMGCARHHPNILLVVWDAARLLTRPTMPMQRRRQAPIARTSQPLPDSPPAIHPPAAEVDDGSHERPVVKVVLPPGPMLLP